MHDLLSFWFGSTDLHASPAPELQARWFAGGPAFDAEVTARFSERLDTPDAVEAQATDPAGVLAAIVTFDQLPRNIFRGSARAFAFDIRALALSRRFVASGADRTVGLTQRVFAYLPFMHAEDRATQDASIALYTQLAADAAGTPAAASFKNNLVFAEKHRDIIARFGRFPGRNLALGREDTPEEAGWLAGGGESFGQR
jgi:uncharacterized protein (DUF924 family)